jgi:hypothetical protein
MYSSHPSKRLNDLFENKPFQGQEPERAKILFIGLDANYASNIESCEIFEKIQEYHSDGVAFWQMHGVHHPFLLPEYSGDGRKYHRNFARIGFTPNDAELISFVELLHVPTVGRNKNCPCGSVSITFTAAEFLDSDWRLPAGVHFERSREFDVSFKNVSLAASNPHR